MTITHEPVHIPIHRPRDNTPRPRPTRPRPSLTEPPTVDVFLPRHNIRIDTMFWQHRSPFLGSQEQLDELKSDADERAAQRARAHVTEAVDKLRGHTHQSVFDVHRPAIRQLKAIVHVGLVPMLWAITTCKCGGRWPCNDIKQYLRLRHGWSTDITDQLKDLTRRLPRPSTRWSRLLRTVTRRFSRHQSKVEE